MTDQPTDGHGVHRKVTLAISTSPSLRSTVNVASTFSIDRRLSIFLRLSYFSETPAASPIMNTFFTDSFSSFGLSLLPNVKATSVCLGHHLSPPSHMFHKGLIPFRAICVEQNCPGLSHRRMAQLPPEMRHPIL